MSYVPTGYPKGRPRKGEMRPLTPKRIAAANYRDRMKNDPLFQEKNRLAAQLWYWSNLEHARQLKREQNQRRKAWKSAKIITLSL